MLDDLRQRFGHAELTLVAIGGATLLGVPLRCSQPCKRNSWLDHVLRLCTTAGLAITGFWLGIMLQLFFVMDLDLFPLGGRIGGGTTRDHGLFTLDALLSLDGAAFLARCNISPCRPSLWRIQPLPRLCASRAPGY